MSFTGEVKNGVVVLDEGKLPEGTKVRVEPLQANGSQVTSQVTSLWEQVIGSAEGLPTDLAENHDHYLHGRPKK